MYSIREMRHLICANHYTHSVPSGESIFTQFEDAILIFARPANNNVSKWLIGVPDGVWDLARMWAPDGHRQNLLTEAISECLDQFIALERKLLGQCHALVSYADPNAGHVGTVYRAASWTYLGQSEESRAYVDQTGQLVPRRKFHAGKKFLVKDEILALGYKEIKRPGKHRFARGLPKWAQRRVKKHAARPSDESFPKDASTVQPCGAAPNPQ